MKWLKVFLVSLLLVLITALIGGTLFFFNVALKTKVSPTDKVDSYMYLFSKGSHMKPWIDSLQRHNAIYDTSIISSDGTKLSAIYVKAPKPTDKTALIIHGYTDNSIRMLMIGHLYNHELGYNILLPDLRGQGRSLNDYIQMGWLDRLDILEWIDVTRNIFGRSTQMVLHGISMGAATTMMVSGENVPENVKCYVEDCGYTSVWEQYMHVLKTEYRLPAFPLLYTTSWYCQQKNGWSFKKASALEQLKKCTKPMLFIHGDKDDYVPTRMVYDLHLAHPGEKELWIAPGTKHATAYWDHTEEYVKKTKTFVNKYLK